MQYKSLLLCVLLAFAPFLASCTDPEPEPEPAKGTIERMTLYSPELKRDLNTTVWLPAGYEESRSYPFLYLLHGYGDDNNSWLSKGSAATILNSYVNGGGVPVVVIMPDALTTFYMGDYEVYMFETLMPAAESRFHCNGKRAVAGLSMGGFGTLFYSLLHPELFLYGYAMSPATDQGTFSALIEGRDPAIFPPLTMESGLQDWTVSIESVRSAAALLQEAGLRCELIERPGGHDWSFWPICLEKALVKCGEVFK